MAWTTTSVVNNGDVIAASWGNMVTGNLDYLRGTGGGTTAHQGSMTLIGSLQAAGLISTAGATLAAGLTAGSGAVAIIDGTGKIPAINSTYFASLVASSLTGIPAANLTGSLPAISGVSLTSLNSGALNNPIAVNKLPSSLFYVLQAQSLANNANIDISVDNTRCGLVIVTEQNSAYGTALFSILGTNNSSLLIAGLSARYNPNLGNASTINCGYSGSVYRVENKTGLTVVVDVTVIGFI